MKQRILDFLCSLNVHVSVETTVKPSRRGYSVGLIYHQCRNCGKVL